MIVGDRWNSARTWMLWLALVAPGASAEELFFGCIKNAEQAEQLLAGTQIAAFNDDELFTTTGDPHLDRYLGRALVRIAREFGERPGFAFIDDAGSPNAYATSGNYIPGTDGTVLFGRQLFSRLINEHDDEGVAVLLVIAHEFAHIAQFRSGLSRRLLQGQRTVKRIELHADYLAGYYLGTLKRRMPDVSLRQAGVALFSIGDFAFNERNHHGTPQERVAAAEAGFEAAFQDGVSYREAFQRSIRYIEQHHGSRSRRSLRFESLEWAAQPLMAAGE